MASSTEKYFILRNDVPLVKSSGFFKGFLSTQNADHVLKGELVVKELQPCEGSSLMYGLAFDSTKKVSCNNYEVAPLTEDDYDWLVAVKNPTDRDRLFNQRDKFRAVKNLQPGDGVWVSLPVRNDDNPSLSTCCHATVRYIGPLPDKPGRYIGVELKVRHEVILVLFAALLHTSLSLIYRCCNL